ncbi:MAG: phage tail tape measure protein [Cetobacterium sp.]
MTDFKLQGEVVLDDNGFKSKLNDLKSEGEKFGSSFKNSMFGSMTAANLAAKGVELLMSTLRSAVNEIGMLDKNLAKVNTLLDQQVLSTTNLKMELLKISDATGIYSSELANATYEALSAGVATDELTGFIEKMTTLSQGGFTSVTQAVNVTTSIMNAYGKEVYTVNEVSDKLVKTQALGKTTVDELSRSLYNVVPAATSMGIGLDDVLASIAVLTASGTPTAQATTQIRQALLEMGDEASIVGKTIQGLTGKSFKQLINEGYSVADVIALLSRESEKSGKSIDGLYSSAEAKGAVITLAKGKVEDFNKAITGIGESAGESAKAQAIAVDNMVDSWSKLATQITNKFISEGGTFNQLNSHLISFAKNTVDILGYAGSLVASFIANTGKALGAIIAAPDTLFQSIVNGNKTEVPTLETPAETVPTVDKPPIPVVGTIPTTGDSSSGGGGKPKTPEQLAREQEQLEREEEARRYEQYRINKIGIQSEFDTLQIEKDVEFFNRISEMRNQFWTDDSDVELAYEEHEYEKFLADQAFKLEQLESDRLFYEGKADYAMQYADTLADIKQLEADAISKSIEREEQLRNKDLIFTQRVSKSKEQLIKGAYSTLIKTNDNMLKALGQFFIDSISEMMAAHGAELMYTGVKDVAKGIAISANPATPGLGAPLIAAGQNEIAQSALFAIGAGAMKSIGGSNDGGSSSGSEASSSVLDTSDNVANREEAVSLEKEKSVTIYTDGDMKDVMLSMLGTLNDLSKDYNNIEIVSR